MASGGGRLRKGRHTHVGRGHRRRGIIGTGAALQKADEGRQEGADQGRQVLKRRCSYRMTGTGSAGTSIGVDSVTMSCCRSESSSGGTHGAWLRSGRTRFRSTRGLDGGVGEAVQDGQVLLNSSPPSSYVPW